ncbi:MAG: hypothetical protein M3220_21165 [Chloroflexota bacterium]|nr:hypothetical protein [Chloroflexota bacterium]
MNMYAVEFQTVIKDGVIEVPAEYRDRFHKQVRVILLTPEQNYAAPNLIDRLLEHPLPIKDFRPLGRDEVYER